jgi:hypothetical protein
MPLRGWIWIIEQTKHMQTLQFVMHPAGLMHLIFAVQRLSERAHLTKQYPKGAETDTRPSLCLLRRQTTTPEETQNCNMLACYAGKPSGIYLTYSSLRLLLRQIGFLSKAII